MSLIFLLFLLSFSISAFSIAEDDEIALLKLKKQLGNPDNIRRWVKGYNFCDGFDNASSDDVIFTGCDSITGRVSILAIVKLRAVVPFPDAICDLTELQLIYVVQNRGIYGPIPSCITKLSNLNSFTTENTSISGPVPDFHNNTKITIISLRNNHLSGRIPPSLSALQHLQVLDLSFNQLIGTVPPGIFHVPSTALRLSNNNLTGKLPKCYGLVDFYEFDVSNNRLNGDASFLFGKQKNISIIILANNSFKFDLSYIEFPNSLYTLDLSHNNVYGKVPDTLANTPVAPRLSLNLSYNRLCGELPQGGYMWQFKAEDFANNQCLCGSPLPPC